MRDEDRQRYGELMAKLMQDHGPEHDAEIMELARIHRDAESDADDAALWHGLNLLHVPLPEAIQRHAAFLEKQGKAGKQNG